ncbi:MAG: hypothetical protein AAGJ40_08710 [Planctomycetota bacterium]
MNAVPAVHYWPSVSVPQPSPPAAAVTSRHLGALLASIGVDTTHFILPWEEAFSGVDIDALSSSRLVTSSTIH